MTLLAINKHQIVNHLFKSDTSKTKFLIQFSKMDIIIC